MSHNDITGDSIRTKPSKAYAENYDRVFHKPNCITVEELVQDMCEGDEEFARMLGGMRKNLCVREPESCPMCDVEVEDTQGS